MTESASSSAGAKAGVPPKPGKAATTGILHGKPKTYGHRIFVDGRVVGEGGRDIVTACGVHRVKVGSSGSERPVDIPCGGTIDVE